MSGTLSKYPTLLTKGVLALRAANLEMLPDAAPEPARKYEPRTATHEVIQRRRVARLLDILINAGQIDRAARLYERAQKSGDTA